MRTFLYTLWLVTLVAGLFCIGIFIQGLVRDQRTGQPEMALDLSAPSSGGSRSFRLWRTGQYDLALSSVNHTPPFDIPFRGRLDVVLTDAAGREIVRRIVDSASAPHMRPNNMSWTPLDSIHLDRDVTGKMTLSARVLDPDPQFAGVRTRLHLRMRQYDPGMGGLVNYVALAPGILFLAIATGSAISIAGRGWGPLALRLTIGLVVLVGAVVMVLRN